MTSGLIGIRFYFSDFLRSNEKYKQGHIIFLMCFSVFIAEILAIILGIYLYWDYFSFTYLSPELITSVILIPRIIFYSVLCYFIYWVLKMLQSAHEYVIEMKQYYEEDEPPREETE